MYLILTLVVVIIFFILDYLFHLYHKEKFRNKFPKNILPPLNENIELPIINKNNEINKTIYRTYYDLDKISLFQKAIDTTQKNMTSYKQVYYDDNDIENFIAENYSERILRAYRAINPDYGPARADFFRYLVIYKYGGIYLDIKSAILANIEEEIINNSDKLLISKGRDSFLNYPNNFGFIPILNNSFDWSDFSGIKYGEYNNWHIIAPAGHPVLGKVIQQIVSNIEYGLDKMEEYKNGEYSVLALTGPLVYTKIIEKYKKDNVVIYPPRLNNKVTYSLENHKNKGSKKHYSQVENKQILRWIV